MLSAGQKDRLDDPYMTCTQRKESLLRFTVRNHLRHEASNALRGVPYCWTRDAWNLGGRPQHLVQRGCCVVWAELHQSRCSPRTGTHPGAICMRLKYIEPEYIQFSETCALIPFSHLLLHSSVDLYLKEKEGGKKGNSILWHFTFDIKKSQLNTSLANSCVRAGSNALQAGLCPQC